MGKITYDQELMKIISFFESMTGARVKDCFKEGEDLLTFVVEEGEIGKAIGKGGSNIRRVESALNRKIKIVEFNPDLTIFTRNLIMPLRAENIQLKDGVLFIKGGDAKVRGMLIGRDSKNLKSNKEIIKKYFNIEKIRVV